MKGNMKKTLKKWGVAVGAVGLAITCGVGRVMAAIDNVTTDMNPNLSQSGISVQTNAGTLLRNIINLVFIVAAVLVLFYLVWGAINWITSGGDKGKVEDARNKITAAVIGILILVATWAIFNLVIQIAFGTDFGGVRLPQMNDG